MAQQLKRWESPRRQGRNDKGRGGSARKRQRQKQLKALAQKLKQSNQPPNPSSVLDKLTNSKREEIQPSLPSFRVKI